MNKCLGKLNFRVNHPMQIHVLIKESSTGSICSKAFKNSNQLSKHKLIHKEAAVPQRCTICQREFSSVRRLRIHIAEVHEKRKPFKCSHCDYSSSRKQELKLHLRSHTGMYIAVHCEALFTPLLNRVYPL